MADASISLYDYSKQLIANEIPMDPILFNQKCLEVAEDVTHSYNYLMLLCHERRDYTVFRLSESSSKKLFATELAEVLYNRGQVLVIDRQPDGAYEIWIRDINTNENFAYYLFNYSEGVIEV